MEGPHIVMGFLVSLIPLLLSHQSPQRGRGRCSGVKSRPTHLRNLLVSGLVGAVEQALVWKSSSDSPHPPTPPIPN